MAAGGRRAGRALQFIRRQAEEWHLDRARIGATGASAGACTSRWLALHDDMGDPLAADPVARESTRLWCAADFRLRAAGDTGGERATEGIDKAARVEGCVAGVESSDATVGA